MKVDSFNRMGNVFVRYQRSSDYEDAFPEAGMLSENEAILFFDNFPFVEDCTGWPQLPINSPYPTLYFTRADQAYARIQMQTPGSYIMELKKEGKYFEILINGDFSENPKREVREFLSEFLAGRLDENLEWTDEILEEGSDSEEVEINEPKMEYRFESSFHHWVYFPETFFGFMSLFLICIGVLVHYPGLIFGGSLLMLIPLYFYSLIWRLRKQVKGSRLAILSEKQSFLWEKERSRRLIHRDEIK